MSPSQAVYSSDKSSGQKSILARRQNQHAGRVRYPDKDVSAGSVCFPEHRCIGRNVICYL